MLRGLLRCSQEGSEEGIRVFHRVGLSLRGLGGGKKAIYLRSTDVRSKDDRLAVGKNNKTGKLLWSSTVSKQRNGGLWHLQDVLVGKFGDVPDKGVR